MPLLFANPLVGMAVGYGAKQVGKAAGSIGKSVGTVYGRVKILLQDQHH